LAQSTIGNNQGVRTLIALLAVSFVAAGGVQAATPTAGSPTASVVIALKSVSAGAAADDKPPKGVSKGDRLLLRSRLLNVRKQFGRPAGATVGRDQALLVMTSAKAGRIDGVATLPGGTIRFRGELGAGGVAGPLSVTGGTGRYARARGTLIVGEGESPLNTYHLRLPAPVESGGPTI
jgi:hypothetical protein